MAKKKVDVHGSAKSAISFYKKHDRAFETGFIILLIFCALSLAFLFRSYSVNLPITEQWAENSVYNSVRSSIDAQVRQNYPNLPATNRDQLVNTQFDKALIDQGDQINQQIELTSAQFKSQLKDETGQTYLIAIDPYQYLRYMEDILEKGHPGDRKGDDGTFRDDHMLAPLGSEARNSFHTTISSLLFRFISLFKTTQAMNVLFWIPAIFSALAVIPAFLLGWRRAGILAGFFTAVLIAVHAGFVGRTSAGFADTDAYVVLFPLLCGWLILEAFETDWGNWRRWGIYLILAGISFGIFATVWEWWYFFDVFLLAIIAYLVYIFLKHVVNGGEIIAFFKSNKSKSAFVTLGGFIISIGVFVSLFTSLNIFLEGPLSAISRTTGIKAAVGVGSLWPNVLTTVAELNAPSISAIIGNIGGKLLFVIALLGVLAALLPKEGKLLWKDWSLLAIGLIAGLFLVGKGSSLSIFSFLIIMTIPVTIGFLLLLKDTREVDVKYALFLFIWLAASVFTMTKGVRFVLLLIPPFAIAAGIAVGTAGRLLREWLVKDIKFSRYWVAPVVFIIVCLLLIPPIQAGHRTGLNEVPSMSDAWWDSLKQIDAEAAPDAIINSWWDFGHWFKYVADRAVTFDGASQNTPMAHWIGRVLITDDEKEALAILRMVDCGSQMGVVRVNEGLLDRDDYESVTLTKEIIMLPPDEARSRLLEEGISAAQTEKILEYTHCEPPENYFITSADMVGKGAVWGHFGSWDFARADSYQNLRKKPQAEAVAIMVDKYSWSEQQASDVYFQMQSLADQTAVNAWVSPWPSYPMSSWSGCSYAQNGTVVECPLGIGIGQQQGYNTVLDLLTINVENVNESSLIIGFYDSNGQRAGENEAVKPGKIVIANNESFTSYTLSNQFGQAFVLDLSDSPRVIMTDNRNAESMFTRLFFMEGFGTTAFEKFSDRNAFNMGRIIVWKVDWTKLEEFDLV